MSSAHASARAKLKFNCSSENETTGIPFAVIHFSKWAESKRKNKNAGVTTMCEP